MVELAAFRRAPNVTQILSADRATPMQLECVSDAYYQVLRTPVALGRLPLPGEARPVMVLTHRAWSRVFARAPDVVGSVVSVSGRSFSIVGVLSPGFEGLLAQGPDAQIPIETGAWRPSRKRTKRATSSPLV